MVFSFEKLEQRHLLAGLSVGIDGPTIVRSGEEVTYVVHVTNEYGITLDVQAEFRSELEDAQVKMDGQRLPTDATFPLGPGVTAFLETTGRTPLRDYFVVEPRVTTSLDNRSVFVAPLSVYVLDRFADEHTIGSEIRTSNPEQGFKISTSLENFVAIDSVDLDGDGLHDVVVDFLDLDHAGTRYRHAVRGAEIVGRLTPASFYARVENSTPVDEDDTSNLTLASSTETRDFDIGDVDRDGYNDIIRTDQSAAGSSGTASIFFGPDHRENHVIFGSRFVGQPGGSPRFGLNAGPLGDVNGDGFNEFFVVDRYPDVNVFFGRDFGRNPTGDLNKDGTVDFSDFLVLAENFDHETNDRALGELDGDGRVTFRDFLLLAENFGKSK